MADFSDHDLGMSRPIARRDFLSGLSVALTGSLAYPWFEAFADQQVPEFAPEKAPGYYPPARTGLRGTHDGAWEVGHALRDGKSWDAEATDTGEAYDLVVVGGGISGLSAAHFFAKAAGPQARILVLDNHDDFGGHAKRNEFHDGDRLMIGYGGTQSIDTPSEFSKEAMGLLTELGIDVQKFYQAFDRKLYRSLGLGQGVFFDKETFGVDRLVAGAGGGFGGGDAPDKWWREFAATAPFSEPARRDFIRLHEDNVDYMPGLSPAEKKAKLNKISYRTFLTDYVKVDPQVIAYFQQRPHGGWAVGIEAMAASMLIGSPGFQGMGLRDPWQRRDPYIFHFPDGNASIARLLVRRMIPKAAPGTTMEDIVTARFNYAHLDEAGSPIRIRLNSTAVRARHLGVPEAADEVVVTYVRGTKAHTVRARQCILACYHVVIPHLCPELPAKQREAMVYGSKAPLVYTNVLIRNWTSFQKLRIHHVYGPATYFSSIDLDFPVGLGQYRNPRSPDEPMVLHLVRTPCKPGLPMREQRKMGRYELLTTVLDPELGDQLARTLSGGGFNAARDIEAITVNRWPHGYAYEGDTLTDPDWPTEEDKPWVIARKRFGRIAIANSDSGDRAYTDAAIDHAYRAVQELTRPPHTSG